MWVFDFDDTRAEFGEGHARRRPREDVGELDDNEVFIKHKLSPVREVPTLFYWFRLAADTCAATSIRCDSRNPGGGAE